MSEPSTAEPQLIDLRHLAQEQVIGAWRVGEVIVDPGPASCLETLLANLHGRAPRVLALTHIHLDHAGAAGSLVRRFPDIEVWVHERGARHLIDPGKLLASAGRLYGADMQRFWGEVLPVPAANVRALAGGESLGAFRVAYTPGHASHHVCYLHEPSGTAFAGDLAGVRIGDGPVLAPTPPPDVDLDAWRASLELLEQMRPRMLALAHFGGHADVGEHLAALRAELQALRAMAPAPDAAEFAAHVRARVRAARSAAARAAYAQAMPPEQSFQGLARHLRAPAAAKVPAPAAPGGGG